MICTLYGSVVTVAPRIRAAVINFPEGEVGARGGRCGQRRNEGTKEGFSAQLSRSFSPARLERRTIRKLKREVNSCHRAKSRYLSIHAMLNQFA